MQILSINNSYNKFQLKTKFKSPNFKGTKQMLQPLNTDSFKTEGAKVLCAKIRKYLQILGKSGSVKDVPFSKCDDAFLSIDGIDKTNIKITTKGDKPLIKANFNKDGQMMIGDMGYFHFERTNRNKRTLATPYGTYKPHGYNDKEWGLSDNLLRLEEYEDNPIFEVFLELTRLYTSIFK